MIFLDFDWLFQFKEHYQSAYMLYSVLAELGYSTAQTNVAELLENHEININGESAIYPRALMHLQRAAEQGNYPARLKVKSVKTLYIYDE